VKGRGEVIDIEKERKWWEKSGYGVGAAVRAGDYLDELEATREELEDLRKCFDATRHKILKALGEIDLGRGWFWVESAVSNLRAQLADQRARDIRMMAHELWEGEDPTGAIHAAAYNYDRLATIEVPAKMEGAS
jgi:hypothetical protein